jgi:hypothetical protein
MRYCYYCNRITQGEPLFCNFCGRSYDVELCPRLHKNPRIAQVCGQCGSRDLSIPAPKAPIWLSVVVFILSLVPGLLLFAISLVFVVAVIHEIFVNPRMVASFIVLVLALTVLWAMWTRLPMFLRRFIRKRLLDQEKERRP